jgi:tetratricopeptide (TPR) repeat protein
LASDRAEQANALQESYAGWLAFASAQVRLQAELPAAERNWTRVERALGALQATPIDKRGASPWRVDFLLADMAAIKAKDSSQSELSQGKPGEILRNSEAAYGSDASYWGEVALAYQHLALPADADRAYGELVKREEQALNTKIVAARLASDRKEYSRAKSILSSAFGSASPSEEARLQGELQRVAQAEGDIEYLVKLLAEQHRRRPNDANILRKQAELALERQDFSALQSLEQELSKKEITVVGLPWALYFRAYRLLADATGDRAQKLREAETAAAELERIWPDRPQAFTLKGLIYRQSGRADLAAAAFEQAIRLGDNRIAVYEQLLPLLDQLNRPVDLERYLSRLNQQTPLSQVLTEVASFHQFRRAQKDQAVKIARSAVKLRPEDAGAYLWLGRVLLVTEQFDEAFAAFQKAVELGPTEVRTWNGLFSYHLRRGDKAQARETLQKLVESIKVEPTERAFIEGQGLELLGDVAQAARAYEQAQATAPTNLGVLLRLANLFLKTDPFKAEGYLDAALRIEKAKKDPQMAVARRMLAVIKMTRGTAADIEKANTLLASPGEDVPVTVDDRRLHALLLARQGSLKSVDRALEMLEEIVSSEPSSVKGDRLVLSQLLEQRARVADTIEARDSLLQSAEEKLAALAVAEDAPPGHLAAFIAFLNRQKRSEDAATWLGKLESLLKGRGAQPDEIAQLIELRISHGSGNQCEPWLQALEKSDPQPLRAASFRARLLTGADVFSQLESLIEPRAAEKLTSAGDAVQKAQIYQQAGSIYFAAKHFVKAESWYRLLSEADPQHFPLLVMAIARQGRLDDAVTLCQETAEKDRGPRPAIALAAALTESSGAFTRGSQADQLFADALKRFGSDIRLLYAIGVLRTIQHRRLEAETAFKDILNLNPNHVASMNNLALVLGEDPKYRKQALKYIERAIEINGLETGLLDTKGALLLYENKPQDAIPLLRAAANGMISDPRHNFHLAVAYRDLGQLDEARDELKQALADDLEAKVLTQRDREFLTDLKRLLAQ